LCPALRPLPATTLTGGMATLQLLSTGGLPVRARTVSLSGYAPHTICRSVAPGLRGATHRKLRAPHGGARRPPQSGSPPRPPSGCNRWRDARGRFHSRHGLCRATTRRATTHRSRVPPAYGRPSMAKVPDMAFTPLARYTPPTGAAAISRRLLPFAAGKTGSMTPHHTSAWHVPPPPW